MKKLFKIFLLLLAALILVAAFVGFGAWSMFGEQLNAVSSIKKLDENLYSMEYRGDYGVDNLMEQGGAANAEELAIYITEFLSKGFYAPESAAPVNAPYGCSTISATDFEGNAVFGRNYDWINCKTMIVHAVPDNGYESVSTVCLDFLGFGEDWLPEGFGNQMMSLAAVYIPLDGVNEKGLAVADLIAGDNTETHQNTDKPDVTTTLAIRLMLDRAANVDEAIAVLSSYDMNSDIGTAHHYSISDATGRSVVIEYIGGEMVVTETDIVTNHYLSNCDKKGVGSEQSHDRFEKLSVLLSEHEGIMECEDVKDALMSVSQGSYDHEYEITVWSIVYILKDGSAEARFYWNENYDKYYTLNLSEEAWIK